MCTNRWTHDYLILSKPVVPQFSCSSNGERSAMHPSGTYGHDMELPLGLGYETDRHTSSQHGSLLCSSASSNTHPNTLSASLSWLPPNPTSEGKEVPPRRTDSLGRITGDSGYITVPSCLLTAILTFSHQGLQLFRHVTRQTGW